ncbi:MAG: OmpA family protein [Myxococcota bacterium]
MWIALMFACVGKAKYDALAGELLATRTEMKAEIGRRDERIQTLEEALEAEQARSKQLGEERARLLSDQSMLKASVSEMEKALRELEERKSQADARIAEFRSLLARFKSLIDAGKLKVKIAYGRMVVELATDILFAPGSADLSPAGKTAIGEVAQVLAGIPEREFQVEGHTDNVPIRTAQYPSNWELASARAMTVVKSMVEAGLQPDRVSAASYADWKPIAPNDTPEGRASNRRIEIVVVPDLSTLPGFDELSKASE